MLEAQTGHRFAEPFRFRGVQFTDALVEIDVAVRAGAGAAGPMIKKVAVPRQNIRRCWGNWPPGRPCSGSGRAEDRQQHRCVPAAGP